MSKKTLKKKAPPIDGAAAQAIFTKKGYPETPEKLTPFLIQRLALNHRTIFVLNESNQLTTATPEQHYRFLYHLVEKDARRKADWSNIKGYKRTAQGDEGLEAVMEYYQVSSKRAKEYLNILTPEQVQQLIEQTSKGGRK